MRMNGIMETNLRDTVEKHDYSFLNPKAGIFYDISQKHSIYASFAIANREPNRYNFVDAIDQAFPNLKLCMTLKWVIALKLPISRQI